MQSTAHTGIANPNAQKKRDETYISCGESASALREALSVRKQFSDPKTFRSLLTSQTAAPQTSAVALVSRRLRESCLRRRRARADRDAEEVRRRTVDVSDTVRLSDRARWTDVLPLQQYAGLLQYVPKLVNVVTLTRLVPIESSSTQLPLPLHLIAERCPGAFFSPKSFAAVQLGFSNPRCRMLVFNTGKLVGTGCTSITEARLAALIACSHMRRHAGVQLRVASFEVVNTVAAVSMNATIDCDGFQACHSDEAMLDRSSFVGMTWRPAGEPICIEIYSTGRANISKARDVKRMLCSFARCIPSLLKHSSSRVGAIQTASYDVDETNGDPDATSDDVRESGEGSASAPTLAAAEQEGRVSKDAGSDGRGRGEKRRRGKRGEASLVDEQAGADAVEPSSSDQAELRLNVGKHAAYPSKIRRTIYIDRVVDGGSFFSCEQEDEVGSQDGDDANGGDPWSEWTLRR